MFMIQSMKFPLAKHTIFTSIVLLISGLLIAQSCYLLFRGAVKHFAQEQYLGVQRYSSNKHQQLNLAKYELFGSYIPSASSHNIPNTMLNLTLVGVLKSSNPRDSQALIRIGTGDDKLYFINDTLPGGAILMRVLDNAIFIKHDGKIEKLTLPKDQLNTSATETPLKFEE